MNSFENIKIPKSSSIPFHLIKEPSFFVEGEEYPLSNAIVTNKKLSINTPIIVLEESVGYEARWAKVVIQNSNGLFEIRGFVPKKALSATEDAKPFIPANTDPQNLPIPQAPEIDWRLQPSNRYFSDDKRGLYCVTYDTGVESLDNNLEDIMLQALYSSIELILKDTGKDFSQEYARSLQDNYYLFGQAEAIDFSFRLCSTLRVLVTIPKKYIESTIIKKNTSEVIQDPTEQSNAVKNDQTTTSELQGQEQQKNQSNQPIKKRYIDIKFNNYEEYDTFFKQISHIGKFSIPAGVLNQKDVIFKSRDWVIEPNGVNVNFANDAAEIVEMRDLIDILIIQNTPENKKNEIFPDLPSVKKDSIYGLSITAIENNWELPTEIPNWSGSLLLKINADDLKISYIRFDTNKNEQVPLNVGVLKFLETAAIKSKKNVNYVLQRLLSRAKYEYASILKNLKNQSSEFANDVIIKRYGPDCLELINFKQILQSDIEAINDEFIEGIDDKEEGVSDLLLIEDLDYERNMSNFIKKYYYASAAKDGKVTSVEVRPLDVTQCVKNSYSLANSSIAKGKNIVETGDRFLNKYVRLKKRDREKQIEKEGNDLLKAVFNPKGIRSKAIRRILDIDKPSKNLTSYQKFNFYVLPAIKEINLNALLIETLKCSSANLSPDQFRDLLNEYNNAKKKVEALAFASVCNPYLVAGMKKFNSFQLPVLPTLNRNKNLADELTNLAINIIQQILIIGIRFAFTRSIEQCVSDKNKEKNPGAANSPTNLADAFSDTPNDDPAVNDTIDDIFGIDPNNIGGPDIEKLQALEDARTQAKEKLKNLLENLMCVLTTKEICDLIRGKNVEADTYEIIKSVIRNKSKDLADNFSTNEDISSLFIKLGNSVNLQICDDILADPNNLLPANPLCDDGTLENARRKLLEDKNLPPEVIDAIIDDVKGREAKNVEDILKFLDSDNPFDATNIPSVLCQKGPNGETIPPVIDVGVPLNSFKSMLDMLLKNTYLTFNQEALEWSKSTYSYTSSAPSTLEFDEQTGKIKAKSIQADSSGKPSPNSEKRLLPAYLFNEIIQSENLVEYSNNELKYISYIDGNKQQKLDANVINDNLRAKVERANDELKKFLGEFIYVLRVLIAFKTIDIANESIQDGLKAAFTNWDTYQKIFKLLGLIDNFLRLTPQELDFKNSEVVNKLITELGGGANEERALYLENSGASLYLKICEILDSNKGNFISLINEISSQVGRGGAAVSQQDINLMNFLGNNQTLDSYFSQSLTRVLTTYNSIKKVYDTVFRTSFNYPSYKINFIENVNTGSIPKNQEIHSVFKLDIKRNSSSSSYLNIEDYEDTDKELSNYIINTLKFDNSLNPSKRDVFNKFLQYHNPAAQNKVKVSYGNLLKEYFNRCRENVKLSPFLSSTLSQPAQEQTGSDGTKNKSPEVRKAYSDYMKLVIEQTDIQKACNIFPHYLDIDSIKEKALESKKQSFCLDQVINQKIINNEPINSKELETLETNETQNILLRSLYITTIRVYAHDLLLRGIGPFGYYDPQILRTDNLFIDYMASQIESEMRSLDTTFFNMMMNFLSSEYKRANPEEDIDISFMSVKRQIFKRIIRQELRKSILPKMSKRIMEDTNQAMEKDLPTDPTRFNLKFISTAKELNKQFGNFLIEKQGNVYLKIDIINNKTPIMLEIPQIALEFKVYEGSLETFNDSKVEFRLLFEYLFPLKKYITILFITNSLCTTTRRQVLDIFRGTKKGLLQATKLVQTNGQPIAPDLNNPQDVANSNTDDDLLWFILKSLLLTPIKIAKGFIEATDPNVAIVSTTYKVAKQFEPDIPSYVVPGVGVSLAIAGIFAPPLFPFALNPMNGAYYGLGLWYEDNNSDEKNKSDARKRKYLNDLIDSASGAETISCGDKNREKIRQDQDDFYRLPPKPVREE